MLKRDIWSPELKNEIIARHGSVQGIPEIPLDLQMLYRTVWEIKQVCLSLHRLIVSQKNNNNNNNAFNDSVR